MSPTSIVCALVALAVCLPAVVVSAEKEEYFFYGAQLEEWEYRRGQNRQELMVWDGDAFVGNDDIKIRWLSEGKYDLRADTVEEMENRLVAQWPISEFFDIKVGGRLDYYGDGKDRWFAVVGGTGLAPQWFEIDADLLLSESGDLSARLDTEYELLLTNYLVLIASAKSTFAFAADTKIGSGAGINNVEAGLRLSYDLIERNVSPYIGVVYENLFADTANFARAASEEKESWLFVAGLKLML